MRPIFFILILVLLGLQYKLWLGDGNIFQWRQLEKKLNAQKEMNHTLANLNKSLEVNIKELKAGDHALEEQARLELGMIKQGEVYYQFVGE